MPAKRYERDYLNATLTAQDSSQVFGNSSLSLMRMFGPNGHTQARNLFGVISYLQDREGRHLEV